MILWARLEPTIWALAAGALTTAAFKLLLGFIFLPGHRHRIVLEKSSRIELIRFGKWIFLSSIMTFFAMQSDKLILGKFVSPALLGMYSIALNFGRLSNRLIEPIGNKIMFPVYSQKVIRSEFSQQLFHRARQPVVLMAALIASAMSASGIPLIEGLYDERYHQAGWMLCIVGGGSVFLTLQSSLRDVLLALGHSKDISFGNIAKLLCILVFLPIGHHFFGMVGMLIGVVAADLGKYLYFVYSARKQGLRVLKQDLALLGCAICAALIGYYTTESFYAFNPHHYKLVYATLSFCVVTFSFIAVTLFTGVMKVSRFKQTIF
jgi:O-antigen/teichoic acid export membrane protein